MPSGPLTDSLRETLGVFDGSGTPRTTTEVADRLDLGRRSTYERLERLVERGRLETKKVGASARVWWRPSGPPADEGVKVATSDPSDRSAPPNAESLVGVLDDTGVGVFVLDEDLHVAWINDATERYFGLDRERVLGRDKRGIVEGEVASVVAEPRSFVGTVLATYEDRAASERFECRVTPGEDRTERWLEHRSEPIESGAYAGGRVELYYDVSDRKRVERARREDREQFESFVEAVEEYAIFRLDPDGHVESWNAGAERIKGYERGAILGEHVSTFYTDEDRAAGVPERNLAAAAENGSVEDEGWRVCADGSRFWANVTITAVRDDDGDLQGYTKVTRDATDRRERERAVRRERNLLERVLETSPTGIGIFEPDGQARHMNRRFTELLGWSDDPSAYSLGEQPLLDEEGEVIPYARRPAQQVLATGEPVLDRRVRIDGPDGRTRWLSVNVEPLGDDAGVVVTMSDVTRLEEQTRRLERQRDDVESELEDVFERVNDGFFALDEDLRFTYVNDRASDLLERGPEELLGEHVREALEPGWEAEVAFGEALEAQEQASFEGFYDPLDAWFEVHAYPSETGLSVYFRDVTERVERERELERYAGIIDAVGEPAYELDERGRFAFVNEPFVEKSGYSEGELLGEHVSIGMDEEAINRAESLMVELLADGGEGNVTLEYDVVTRGGERIPVENRISLLTDDDGRITGSVGVLWDVTERVEREQELVQFETLFEKSKDVNVVVDPDGTFRYVTPSSRNVFGYEPEEMVGDVGFEYIHPEDREEATSEFARMLEDPEYDPTVEFRFRHGDGSWMVIEASAHNHLADPDIEGVVIYTRDVTERVERERQLEESRRRLGTLVEHFPNGAVALVDEDLRYVTVGGTPVEGADVTVDELEGMPLRGILPPDLADLVAPRYEAALDGEPTTFEAEVGERVYQFRIVPVRDDDGEVLAALGMSQDVTERKEHERELVRRREQLVALNSLNEVVHGITDAVVDRSTREEIEAAVCEHLAASDSYLFAWIGDVDVASRTVTRRAEAGADGSLDDVAIPVDPDGEGGENPTASALRTGEVLTTRDVHADADHHPPHDHVEGHGVSSWAAIPIVHEGTVYAVLHVYAGRPSAFEGQEREVVGQLGEIVGHAIAATERKRALMSDEVVELEFHVEDAFELPAGDALDGGGGDCDGSTAPTIALDEAVPLGDEEFLVYGSATADAVGTVEALVGTVPHWVDVRFHEGNGDAGFELRLSEPPVLSVLASLGGSIEGTVIEDGDYRMRIHVAPGADVRRITDAVREAYPEADLLKQRQVTRRDAAADRVGCVLTAELTGRQRAALEAAYHAGFFEWPRLSTGEELAESLGVSPPTFHQHLRAAERKVFDSLLSIPSTAP